MRRAEARQGDTGEASSTLPENGVPPTTAAIRLLLCGDVMTGRGIDQVLPHPSAPVIYEPWVKSATDYVRLAEAKNGPIGRRLGFDYVWGGAPEAFAPDVRIANLETAVTTAGVPWPKGINYRMNPANLPCLAASGFDCWVLANNHVMDWRREGLIETIAALHGANIRIAGAGNDGAAATAPAAIDLAAGGRVLVFALAFPSSGVPADWAADEGLPGVNLVAEPSAAAAEWLAAAVRSRRRNGDLAVCSIHWGGNWGYEVPEADRAFAHRLIDVAGIDVVHGHSSHHPKAIEVYRGKPILYGCGDFLNDYEGIESRQPWRSDIVAAYVVEIDRERGVLSALEMIPFRIVRFRLTHPEAGDIAALARNLDRECRAFGGAVAVSGDSLHLSWRGDNGDGDD
jgi:poly-gamma-glutamate capsule biosynthesis protein CapA/YwtB (metallophosphatase superfamily)